MDKRIVKENSFDGSPSGIGGISNYSAGYGTFASPDVSQNPAHFSAYEKGTNHMNNQDSIDTENIPINTTGSLAKDVDQLFTKKVTPTPDDVMCGLQYELDNMVKKDKRIAKQVVLKNLRKDPKFYSRLKMLNIDDTMDENQKRYAQQDEQIAETKKVLDQMISERKKDVVVPEELTSIMKNMWADKREKLYGRREEQ